MSNRWRPWRGLRKPMTYKTKLLLYSLVLGVLPIFLLGSISSGLMKQSIQTEVNNHHQNVLRQLKERIDDMLLGLERTSVQLAEAETIRQSLKAGMDAERQVTQNMISTMMNALVYESIPLEMSLYYTRHSMMYSSRYGIVRDVDYPYSAVVRSASSQQAGSFFIPTNTFPFVEDMFFVRSVPLHSAEPLGFLIAQLNKDSLRLFLDSLELGGGRKVMIIDDKGAIVVKQEVPGIGEQLRPADELYPFWEGGKPYAGTVKLESVRYNVTAIPSSVRDWTYMALTPLTELSAKANHISRMTWAIMAGMLIVWGAAAGVASSMLYRPIRLLAEKFRSPAKMNGNRDMLGALDAMMERITDRNKQLQQELDDHKPYRKEMILQQLLTGASTPRELRIASKEFDLSVEESRFYVAVAQLEVEPPYAPASAETDRFALMRKLRRLVEELCELAGHKVYTVAMPGHIAILFHVPEPGEKPLTAILTVCDNIRLFADADLRVPVSVAVSNPRLGRSGLGESYREAVRFLGYKWTLGGRSTIHASFVKSAEPKSLRMLARWKTAVVASLMKSNVEEATRHLARLAEELPDCLRHSGAASGLFAMLLSEIGQSLKERGYELDLLVGYDAPEHLFRLRSREEMLAWFGDVLFPTVAACLDDSPALERRQVIRNVLAYIHTHYESDLSLQKLADIAQVSTTALSRMFKEETDINYMEYVIHLRMNKAKEWLAETDLSIKEIARRLQYATVQNFNRIFKQVTGATPGMFRKHAGAPDGKPSDSPPRDRTGTV